jgi:hypothetical protein
MTSQLSRAVEYRSVLGHEALAPCIRRPMVLGQPTQLREHLHTMYSLKVDPSNLASWSSVCTLVSRTSCSIALPAAKASSRANSGQVDAGMASDCLIVLGTST